MRRRKKTRRHKKASNVHRRRRYSYKPKYHRRRKRAYGTYKKRYRRRKKHYARKHNPLRRRHRRRYRRNASVTGLARRSYGTATKLFSVGMAKNVVAGIVGFASLKYVEGWIPYQPTTFFGELIKKGIAAVGIYTVAGFIPGVSRSMKRYVLYGSALNIGFDLLQQLPQFAPGIASATKMSGYSGGYGALDIPQVPERLTPTALIAPVLS